MTSISAKFPIYSIQYPLTPCVCVTKQRGFSLLELVISLFIFAVGFLGLASLQHVSMKMTHDSVLQNSAMTLSNSLLEQLRVTKGAVNLAEWQERVKKELPQGRASLIDQGGQYQLNIQWQESQHSAALSNLQAYQTTFKIHP
tara:strand:+ start:9395 stop:9823 length:429 start_codon:yes stop_codon:yes gene_type:complete